MIGASLFRSTAALLAQFAATAGASLVGFIQAGAGAVARTLQAKAREVISFDDFAGVVGDGVNDDTAGMQAALDAAPAGSIVRGTPGKHYYWTNLATGKALVIDFCGAQCTVAPSLSSLTDSDPAISFESAKTGPYSLETPTELGRVVTLTDSGDAALFQAGDLIIFRDLFFTPGWDIVPNPGTALGFYGRGEVNVVLSVAGADITLEKPIEHLYSKADTGTVYRVAKADIVAGAVVKNIRKLTEVDPGARYTGSMSSGPHLFDFRECVAPRVENVVVEGYQLHAFQFTRCIGPRAVQCVARKPFRPAESGHGYGVQFNRSVGGLADQLVCHGVRHAVDNTQSYDCGSQNCTSFDAQGSQFIGHGQLSRRLYSVNDTVYSDSGAGWGSGNPAFGADYDYTIINPSFYGTGAGSAFLHRTLSERMTIINPRIVVTKKTGASALRLIYVMAGAKDLRIVGGSVDFFNVSGSSSDAVLSSEEKTDATDPYGVAPVNIEVRNLKIRGNTTNANSVNLLNFGGVAGRIELADLSIDGYAVNCTAVRVQTTATPADLLIDRITFTGNLRRGVHVEAAPTGLYAIKDLRHGATVYDTAATTLAASALLDRSAGVGVTVQGDASLTLIPGTSPSDVVYTAAITTTRTVTLSTTGAYVGARFRITRAASATGGNPVNVGTGPLKALALGQWCEVTYTGAAWALTQFGSL